MTMATRYLARLSKPWNRTEGSYLILYDYWRSSAAYRVRIALNLKNIAYQSVPVNLIKDGGEQHRPPFNRLNPNELVPVLIDGDIELNQSLTIIDYLDAHYPEPRLVPRDERLRYQVTALAQDIAIDIHPINNLRVIQHLSKTFGIDDDGKQDWMRHWINKGFNALEQKLTVTSGKCCVGDEVSLADVCLVPQVYNARRFGVDMSSYPHIVKIVSHLQQLDAFEQAEPEQQPDAT